MVDANFVVEPDLIVCENSAVFEFSSVNITPEDNFTTLFQEHGISINCAVKFFMRRKYLSCAHATYFLGGPTGFWSSFCIDESFSKWTVSPDYFIWKGAKDFKDDNLQWFLNIGFYFNAKNNVYEVTNKEPFYEIVWENLQIVQMSGNDWYHGCLLNNGEFWVKNDLEWIHVPFYDNKNVKNIADMNEITFILCEYPEQKLYSHQNFEDFSESTNVSIDSKKILKIVNLCDFALCWCVEGFYAWKTLPSEEEVSVCQFYPLQIFEDKKVLDIGVSKNFYVLCDDGVYVIPLPDNYEKRTIEEIVNLKITPIKVLFFDENMPLFFLSQFNCKLGKSARSRINTAEQLVTKKQKIVDYNDE